MFRTHVVSRRLPLTLALGTALLLGGLGTSAAAAAPIPTRSAAPAIAASSVAGDTHTTPRIVRRWAQAWNSGDGEQLARLYTSDAVYTDHAFGATFTGRDGVAAWVGITNDSIDNVQIDVVDAFRSRNQVAIEWTFSGTIVGAPAPFSVPAVTVLQLRHGAIATNDDYYNLADVLRQSGLPADLDLTAPPA